MQRQKAAGRPDRLDPTQSLDGLVPPCRPVFARRPPAVSRCSLVLSARPRERAGRARRCSPRQRRSSPSARRARRMAQQRAARGDALARSQALSHARRARAPRRGSEARRPSSSRSPSNGPQRGAILQHEPRLPRRRAAELEEALTEAEAEPRTTRTPRIEQAAARRSSCGGQDRRASRECCGARATRGLGAGPPAENR